MWHWEQGRLAYFQHDALRAIARLAVSGDLRQTNREVFRSETGLEFPPHDASYAPWRNYSRIFKLCLVVSEVDGQAMPTDIAKILAQPGMVTCDEYIHFLVLTTTHPSPAFKNWNTTGAIKYPLAFSLKYILAKTAIYGPGDVNIDEIIGAFCVTGFDGTEDDTDFIRVVKNNQNYVDAARQLAHNVHRQARESIKFLCQISYLHSRRSNVVCALAAQDAMVIFEEIEPVLGDRVPDGNQEIQRLAAYFRDGTSLDIFDYPATTQPIEIEGGFLEGGKVKKSHIVRERNSQLRNLYFRERKTSLCDACQIDTRIKYPWTQGVLDVHHILPLSSGTRVESKTGTILDDLIAICPTCHRAIHRYYDAHLRNANQLDFADKNEAQRLYQEAKAQIIKRR